MEEFDFKDNDIIDDIPENIELGQCDVCGEELNLNGECDNIKCSKYEF